MKNHIDIVGSSTSALTTEKLPRPPYSTSSGENQADSALSASQGDPRNRVILDNHKGISVPVFEAFAPSVYRMRDFWKNQTADRWVGAIHADAASTIYTVFDCLRGPALPLPAAQRGGA
jgi:hypothetical protein